MKKRWIIFWAVCGVTALLGLVLCLVGLGLGATLDRIGEVYRDGYVFEDYDKEDPDISGNAFSGAESFDGVRSLDVEVGKARVVIEESDGTEIKVDGSGLNSKQKLSCKQEGTELEIKVTGDRISSGEVTLLISIPKEQTFEEVSFDVGGGVLKIENIAANILDISVGAGETNIERFQAGELDVECGAGIAALAGELLQRADLECGVGELELKLIGKETDFNYSLECGIGTIDMGNSSFSGLGTERYIDNGQSRELSVECGVGSVELQFMEEL